MIEKTKIKELPGLEIYKASFLKCNVIHLNGKKEWYKSIESTSFGEYPILINEKHLPEDILKLINSGDKIRYVTSNIKENSEEREISFVKESELDNWLKNNRENKKNI